MIAIPKGRMNEEILTLFKAAGVKLEVGSRAYRPKISLPNVCLTILYPSLPALPFQLACCIFVSYLSNPDIYILLYVYIDLSQVIKTTKHCRNAS